MNYRGVYGGTKVGTESLCDSCVYVRMIKGYAESERITICDRLFEPMRIPFKVSECSDYSDKRLPAVEDMEQIAWMLVTNKPGRPVGFVPAAEFQRLQDNDEDQS
jgi:hypothetical protein